MWYLGAFLFGFVVGGIIALSAIIFSDDDQ